uniref:ATP synthase F0 subunit 8 n=1 Tax=Wildemania schizophylla TaxID=1134705 RepID=A0A068EY68_WILSC|nr:ATP synthase F0 subunit 8 [Wildemania schizophylla]AID57256.1 ATP synthase F0 subunit 8 [Wildemania schizophylla]
MPQLDRVIIFSQIFWLFLTFVVAYIVYTHFVLSNLLKIFLVRWWKLRKDITQIALKSRLTELFINANIKSTRTIYFTIKNIVLSIGKDLTKRTVNKKKISLSDLNRLVLSVSLEIALYTSKSITKSGTYSPWT